MSFVFLDFFARGGVPETDGIIETRGRQSLAVGAPGDRINRVGMTLERADDRGLLRHRDTRRHERRQKAANPRGYRFMMRPMVFSSGGSGVWQETGS